MSPSTFPRLQEQPIVCDEEGIRYLHFESAYLQGAMRLARPTELIFPYIQQMMAWLLFLRPDKNRPIGILGLGAGSLLRYCLRYTHSPIDVVEWNPLVTQACQQYFKIPPSHPRIAIHHQDAHAYLLKSGQSQAFQALMVDLYNHEAQGPVCSSLAFYQACCSALRSPGVMTVNLFANHPSVEPNLHHIYKAFKGRSIALPETVDGNAVILGFVGPEIKVSKKIFFDRVDRVKKEYGLDFQEIAEHLWEVGKGCW